MQHAQPVQSDRQALEASAQVGAAGRFWQICMAIEMGADPSLKPNRKAMTFTEDRRVIRLIAAAGKRAIQLLFGVVLRDATYKPEIFTPAIAGLANAMAFEIGDSLSNFPFEERVRILEGLTAKLAEGLQIAFVEPDPTNH